jgi:hypothetical protein
MNGYYAIHFEEEILVYISGEAKFQVVISREG